MNGLDKGLHYQDSINNALWAACNSFRGIVSVDTYKGLILSMLFLRYISDVWQDRYGNFEAEYDGNQELIEDEIRNVRFFLPSKANFYSLYQHRHEPGNGERINQALHVLEEVNSTQLKGDGISVFQSLSFNSDELGEENQKNAILCRLLEDFAKPELNLKPSRVGALDVISNAFEFLMKNFAASPERKAGDFYTPPEVSNLLAELLDPQPGDRICDPACGSGSLLLEFGKKVITNHKSEEYALYGQEVLGGIWSIAKMNMLLHGEVNHKIEWGDTIRIPKLLDKNDDLLLFDVVAASLPFSLNKWGYDEAKHDKYGRFHRGLPPKSKGIYAFILHMLATLKPKIGRMGVVVPQGVLFRGLSEGRIRKKLIEENLLDAVIGLPTKLFYGSSIPVVILVFKMAKNDDSVLLIEASREFKAGKYHNVLTDENITKILVTYRNRASREQYAYLSSLEEIKENDYNLNIPLYDDFFKEKEQINLMAERVEREHLMAQLIELESEMVKYMDELGYGENI